MAGLRTCPTCRQHYQAFTGSRWIPACPEEYLVNHEERIRRHYDPETRVNAPSFEDCGECGEHHEVGKCPAVKKVKTAETKVDALFEDIRGTVYVDDVDPWKIRQLARALVRKGWRKE